MKRTSNQFLCNVIIHEKMLKVTLSDLLDCGTSIDLSDLSVLSVYRDILSQILGSKAWQAANFIYKLHLFLPLSLVI